MAARTMLNAFCRLRTNTVARACGNDGGVTWIALIRIATPLATLFVEVLMSLCFLGCVVAASLDVGKRASPIEVNLESVGNSAIKASITNTGSDPLTLFTVGTLLDSRPTEKVEIYSAATSEKLMFHGVRLSVDRTHISWQSLVTLGAGETVDHVWDPAEVYDLSTGGEFSFRAQGTFLTVDPATNQINGAIGFESNVLISHVGGAAAAQVRRAYDDNLNALMKRILVGSDCDLDQRSKLQAALRGCMYYSLVAINNVLTMPAKRMEEYFKSSDPETRKHVYYVYSNITTVCDDQTSGPLYVYCSDVSHLCFGKDGNPDVYAYVTDVHGQPAVATCPLYFTDLQDTFTECHGYDRCTVLIHEMSHLFAGTGDLAYGYPASMGLNAEQAILNADTYELFANALMYPC